MNNVKKLELSLFSLRLGVFVVMIMWTIDKFLNPGHAAAVFDRFYLISSLSVELAYGIGFIQLLVVLGFLFGIYKKWTYGAILFMHAVSTFSSWEMYLDPWGPRNLLFFAAWPMLAAIFSLYMMRDQDNFLTLKKSN
ncbi:MAG: hypothetical protein CL677_06580 [Bdellovibrionaceae bacterium]|nr:hypothetical protein [Pseudobdellovibrionaceae bacterium]|tara:strand:- start:52048 stop:52458 length:411 start_codon:yes stop_codon:yes gene_type:complete